MQLRIKLNRGKSNGYYARHFAQAQFLHEIIHYYST